MYYPNPKHLGYPEKKNSKVEQWPGVSPKAVRTICALSYSKQEICHSFNWFLTIQFCPKKKAIQLIILSGHQEKTSVPQ